MAKKENNTNKNLPESSDNNNELTKEILEAYPMLESEEEAKSIVKMVSKKISIKSGPYPSPKDYAKYHKIDPNLTTQMKDMVKKDHELYLDLTKKDSERIFVLRQRGQYISLGIVVLVIGLGFFTISKGFEWGGVIITSLGAGSIIAQFLTKR